MAGITKSTDTSQEYQFQTHYSKLLLEQIRKNFVLPDFAVKSPLPGKAGARSMRMFRFATPSTSDIQTVTEGTIPATSTHKQLTLEYVEVTLAQYLQTISITDKLDATGLISMMDHATEQNGLDAALHFDTLIRNELKVHTGTSGNVDYSTQNFIYAQAATNYAGVYNSGTASASYVITSTDVLDGVTALKKNNAPKIGGYYILATAPDITRDLMKGVSGDTAWLDAAKYSNTTALYNGEVGRIWGARVVETTNPFRAAGTQGTYSASGGVFSSFLFGKGAFGVSDLSTLGSPNAPKIFIVKGADKSDPANLIAAMVSFKTYFAAKLVQPLWLTQIYSQSGYGA
jgi:N4-gp56 family major capsid protein